MVETAAAPFNGGADNLLAQSLYHKIEATEHELVQFINYAQQQRKAHIDEMIAEI